MGQKPVNPALYAAWRDKVLADPSSKRIELRNGVFRWKFLLSETDYEE